MPTIILCIGFCLLLSGPILGATDRPTGALMRELPSREVTILLQVGKEYGLSADSLKLLIVIRKIENGGPGLEMGVASDFPAHRSHRHAGDADKSLRLQARWAAGTIRKHYTGDLATFAKRYCPPKWEHWTQMAQHWMARQ